MASRAPGETRKRCAAHPEEADLEGLRAQGLGDADIWDTGSVAAFFNLSNRMASLADLQPNREFWMGRG